MPKGVYKHPKQCGFQKGHNSFLTEESKRKISKKLKGHKPYLGMTGKHHSNKSRKKISLSNTGRKRTKEQIIRIRNAHIGIQRGKKNACWKGENACYAVLHQWVKRWKGKPKKCIDCGITYKKRKIQWSNIDHKYRRHLDDYVARCIPCHKKYDKTNKLTIKK